jgi:alkanesulfonate monooxygenase SsuD/methylene tetrahydromethanopterin reductase-like flavin-dependent oxidoreductase (luciferase family)
MRYAVNLPNLWQYSDPQFVVDLAVGAEAAGWDGFFLWDHILGADGADVADTWVLLAAVAQATQRIRIGPTVTPLPRRRPWVLARQAVTLDHLSGGRVVLGLGLGTPPETEYATFGEDPGVNLRAAKLDEGLEILTGMWKGERFAREGVHYSVGPATFLPAPIQRPRIPIWLAATVGSVGPLRRAARYDGVFPVTAEGGTPRPDEVAAVVDTVREHRTSDTPFDVAVAGPPPTHAAAYEDAGVTWYQVGPRPDGETPEHTRAWVAEGPPIS